MNESKKENTSAQESVSENETAQESVSENETAQESVSENETAQESPKGNEVSGAGPKNIGCMVGAIIGIILFIAAIITAVVIIVMSLFSDNDMFGDWDFGFIDDMNQYLAETFDGDTVVGEPVSAKVAGLHLVVNDYYYEDIGMSELNRIGEMGEDAFIVDVTISNEERDQYSVTPSAFHLDVGGTNAYPYFDGSTRINGDDPDTGEYREYLFPGETERYLVVFEVPSYIDFEQDKTLVFSHYLDNEEAHFELPE